MTVGRREEADISLPWDEECSRLHAELEWHAGRVDGLRRRLVAERHLGQRAAAGRPPAALRRRHGPGGPDRDTLLQPGGVPIGPTLVPGELSATPKFSEQQQRILRALCRPLFGDGEGVEPSSDDEIAAWWVSPSRP